MSSVAVFSKYTTLLQELRRVLPSVNFQEVLTASSPLLKESEIIVCDYDLIAPVIYDLPKTKWLQGTWAGVDKILPGLDRNKIIPFPITRFSGKHFGRIMSEYIIAEIVGFERGFDQIASHQKLSKWSDAGRIGTYRVISDLNIGILGLGQIGSWVAQYLDLLGATIFGFARNATPKENVKKYITEYYTPENLGCFLKNCDYIINILPNTKETRGLLNGDVLQNCKEKGTVFVNVGRGTIISEDCLIIALEKKWLSAAILDVFNTEPLPKESPLWKMPQVRITPHVSASSRPRDIAEQFKENYDKFMNNEPLSAVLDIQRGY